MRLGLSSAAFYGMHQTEEAAAHLATLPLDTCEIFVQTFSEYTADFGRLVRRELKGLDCTSIHPKNTHFEGDLFSPYPRQVEDAFRILEGVCAAGQALGARYYVMHGFWGIRTRRTPGQIHQVQERMDRIRRTAAPYGITVLWENVSWCTLNTPEDVQQVRSLMPEQGFVLDVKQCIECGVSPTGMVRAMGDRLKHVHVLDKCAQGYRLPGQGDVDWDTFFGTLREVGYEGSIILEPYLPQARDPEALLRSLDFLRRKIAD